MADFLGALFGEQGCQVDGTMGLNPINQLIDHFAGSLGPISENMMSNTMASSAIYDENEPAYYLGENSSVMQFDPSSSVFDVHNNLNSNFIDDHNDNTQENNYSSYIHSSSLMSMMQNNFIQENMRTANQDFQWNEDNVQYSQEELFDLYDNQQSEEYSSDFVQTEGISKEKYKDAWQNVLDNLENVDQSNSYSFARENPYLSTHSAMLASENPEITSDFFEKGVQMFEEGNIQAAIHSFEAELQQNNPDHVDAWHMLGSCHAENDEDKRAISCFRRALECDPYHLDALLSIGISYVNEVDSIRALESLRSWISHNPNFYNMDVSLDEYSDGTLMDEVTQLMLAVSAQSPEDADVKVVLGVLYNVSLDYDAAIDNFNAAILQRPDDYSLLNKLGATLANSNRSGEAIALYNKSLQLRPQYVRGLLNLGISFANLNQYADSAKAYIKTLRLNPNAKHIWNYLRMVLSCMDRMDLVEIAGREDLESLETSLGISTVA